jgi:hypothetical protein
MARLLYSWDMNPRRRHITERPFSFRDAYRDVGGRAKHGALAEKDRMRGYTIRQLYLFYPLSPTLPAGEGVYGAAVTENV